MLRALAAGLEDEQRDAIEVDRRGRAGEIEHSVHFTVDVQRLADVVLDERELR